VAGPSAVAAVVDSCPDLRHVFQSGDRLATDVGFGGLPVWRKPMYRDQPIESKNMHRYKPVSASDGKQLEGGVPPFVESYMRQVAARIADIVLTGKICSPLPVSSVTLRLLR